MNRISTFLICLAASVALTDSASGDGGPVSKGPRIRLQKIKGRTWLVRPDGRPFFAHGVTHIGGRRRKRQDIIAIGNACKELGFNAYGYGCPDELKKDLPYLVGRNFLPISMYRSSNGSFRYVDIFDPKVQAGLEQQIRTVCLANRKNPNLIGYFWTDLAAWPLKNSTGKNWVEFLRGLPADTPGQKAYRGFLKTWKGDDAGKRDRAFLRIIAREYFRVMGKANKKYDPDHLIFGDRFTFQTGIPEVIEEMLPYVDAVAIQPRFQPKFPRKDFDRIHKLSGKPIIICDFAIRFKEKGKKIRGWKPVENPRIAGQRYAEYIRDAIATPYIIGAFWCNPINSKPNFMKTGIKQGLFDQGLTPRPELNRSIRELNRFLDQTTPKS